MICPPLGRCNDALFSFFFSSTSFFVYIVIPLFRSSSLSIYLSIYLLPYFLLFLFQAIYLYLFSLSLDLPLSYLPIYPRALSQCIIVTNYVRCTYTYIFSLSPSRPSLLPFHIRMYIYAKYRWKHARVYDVLCCIVRLVANGRVCRVHFQIFLLFKYEKNIIHKRNMNISRSEFFMRHFILFYFYFIFILICLYKYLLY